MGLPNPTPLPFSVLDTEIRRKRDDIDLTNLSVFEMFSIGVGPSSSHTVGPMRSANAYIRRLREKGLFDQTHRLKTELFGSLALTGEGHATPKVHRDHHPPLLLLFLLEKAILMGLEGNLPDSIDPSIINHRVIDIRTHSVLKLGGSKAIHFDNTDLILCKTEFLPFHSNGMRFTAYDERGNVFYTFAACRSFTQ